MQWIESGNQVPFDPDNRRKFASALRQGDFAFSRLIEEWSIAEDRMNNFEY